MNGVILWGMIFALGFLSATLGWLLSLPFVSRRATRLAAGRLAESMPPTAEAVRVERDQFRAAHAIEVRRLEKAGQALGDRLAAAMSESGRVGARVLLLEQETADLRAEGHRLQNELIATSNAKADLDVTVATQTAALKEATSLAKEGQARLGAIKERLEQEQTLTDERRATIAGLETRVAGLDAQLRSARMREAELQNELTTTRAELETVARERSAERADHTRLAAQEKSAGSTVGGLTAELGRVREQLDEARRRASRTARQAQLQSETVAGLADRVLAQDHRILELQQSLNRVRRQRPQHDLANGSVHSADALAERSAGSGASQEAQLRAAVASLGAELVAFATEETEISDQAGVRLKEAGDGAEAEDAAN